MPLFSRLPRSVPALPILAAAVLVSTATAVTVSPAKAADGLLDTMLQAAKEAPVKLYEGKAKSYRAGVMTPGALKACLVLAHRIDGVTQDIERNKASIGELDGRIQEAGPRLQDQAMAALTDPQRRETYETQIAEYNGWVEQRRRVVESHNRGVRLFSEMSGRFNGECNGRAYFPSDLDAVKPDLPPDVAQKLP